MVGTKISTKNTVCRLIAYNFFCLKNRKLSAVAQFVTYIAAVVVVVVVVAVGCSGGRLLVFHFGYCSHFVDYYMPP